MSFWQLRKSGLSLLGWFGVLTHSDRGSAWALRHYSGSSPFCAASEWPWPSGGRHRAGCGGNCWAGGDDGTPAAGAAHSAAGSSSGADTRTLRYRCWQQRPPPLILRRGYCWHCCWCWHHWPTGYHYHYRDDDGVSSKSGMDDRSFVENYENVRERETKQKGWLKHALWPWKREQMFSGVEDFLRDNTSVQCRPGRQERSSKAKERKRLKNWKLIHECNYKIRFLLC